MKLSILAGSGISIESGMPSMDELTTTILNGENIYLSPDTNYYINNSNINENKDQNVELIIKFLKILNDEVYIPFRKLQGISKDNIRSNYEVLFSLVRIFEDQIWKHYENPAVLFYMQKYLNEARLINNDLDWNIFGLSVETMNFIKDIIWHSLSKMSNPLNYLHFFKELHTDKDVTTVDVFSLNHDTILEQYFKENNIIIEDGFSSIDNSLRAWDWNNYFKGKNKIYLYKLHGSINWLRVKYGRESIEKIIYIPISSSIKNERYKIIVNCQIGEERPTLLIGSISKLYDYTEGIFRDLYTLFNLKLKTTKYLIVTGYGFGDIGLNNRIIDWFYSKHNNTIILIYPDINKTINTASGAIVSMLNNSNNQNRIKRFEKCISGVMWNDVKKEI